MSRLAFLFVLLFVGCYLSQSSLASSPSEPAYSSQLRTCFEPNRDTKCIATTERWYSCGGSMYSSYEQAVSVSLNCMRSTCGIQNSLCCNTYCGMFGVSGYEYNVCFDKCFNPQQGVVAATATAAATTLMRPVVGQVATTRADIAFDDDSDFVPKSLTSDDNTVVKCSISCDATYAFYSAKVRPDEEEKSFFRTLLANDAASASTLSAKKKLIANLKQATGRPSVGKAIISKTRASAAVIRRPARGSTISKPVLVKKIKKTIKKNGGSTSGGNGGNKDLSKLVKQRIQVFDIPLSNTIPSKEPIWSSSLVGSNQICSGTNQKVEVTYYKRSRVTCRKIQNWMKDVTAVSPNNLLTVYKFMLLVHSSCRAKLPKGSKQCVAPMYRRINLNTNVL